MQKNRKSLIVAAVVIIAFIGIIAWGVSARNSFVILDENVSQQWSEVQNQYQRRLDLIPNLVETVKGYASHESTTFENVTRARAGLESAYNTADSLGAEQPATEAGMNRYATAQQELGKQLSIYVNAVREAYPDLKANQQFLDLQTQLEGTENRIATARGRYIDQVREFNVGVRRFPASVIASLCGFDVKPQFQADEAASAAPKVSF